MVATSDVAEEYSLQRSKVTGRKGDVSAEMHSDEVTKGREQAQDYRSIAVAAWSALRSVF